MVDDYQRICRLAAYRLERLQRMCRLAAYRLERIAQLKADLLQVSTELSLYQ